MRFTIDIATGITTTGRPSNVKHERQHMSGRQNICWIYLAWTISSRAQNMLRVGVWGTKVWRSLKVTSACWIPSDSALLSCLIARQASGVRPTNYYCALDVGSHCC